MKSLTFTTLRLANLERLPLFKNCHGEPAHTHIHGRDWTRADWLEAVTGELGEYANKSKKERRGDISPEEFYREARKELADVAIYLDILAFQIGFDLGEAIRDKFNEVSKRVGAPVFISDQCEVVRDADLISE